MRTSSRDLCAIALPPSARDLHIPMGEITSRIDELRAAAGSEAVVVYCHHGVRSLSVASWLTRQGVSRVHNLTGGIDAWSQRVDPSVPQLLSCQSGLTFTLRNSIRNPSASRPTYPLG